MLAPDVVLIYPPYEKPPNVSGRYCTCAPLGLCYLAKSLKKEGYSVSAIDCNVEDVDVVGYILKKNPKIIGIYTTSPGLRYVKSLIGELRGRGVTSAIATGGPHITADIKSSEKLGADAYFIGEAENEFPKYCRKVINGGVDTNLRVGKTCSGEFNDEKHAPNIIFCGETDNISALEHPSRGVFTGKYGFTPLAASRGCPFNCVYCGMAGTKYRKRNIKDIEEEVEELKNHGVKKIELIDDSYTLDRDFSVVVAEILDERGISFNCTTRADLVDEQLIKSLSEKGLTHINFGVESGDYEVRKSLGKDIKDDTIIEAFRLCKRYGVKTTAYGIIGGPSETRETILKTFSFIRGLNPDEIMYSPMIIHPKTNAYEMAVNEGVIEGDSWTRYMEGIGDMPVYLPKNMSIDEVNERIYLENKSFYFTSEKILKRITSSRTVGEFGENLAAGAIYLTSLFHK
ncbi:MAG: B12-binding domain-containing radical SAM protein [Candidatus Altiarchaeota archaeon]|nr:B12-binding domain-containing radical SAM protein [Candidatus Altiarchaeota archaeon]